MFPVRLGNEIILATNFAYIETPISSNNNLRRYATKTDTTGYLYLYPRQKELERLKEKNKIFRENVTRTQIFILHPEGTLYLFKNAVVTEERLRNNECYDNIFCIYLEWEAKHLYRREQSTVGITQEL
jgi:hypothetical protein